jgi:hypothetical protein
VQAGGLLRELRRRGLEVLAVSQHRSDPQVLIVYLHGNAGQWAGGYALEVIASVPEVLKVEESVTTPTILLALVETHPMDVETVEGERE